MSYVPAWSYKTGLGLSKSSFTNGRILSPVELIPPTPVRLPAWLATAIHRHPVVEKTTHRVRWGEESEEA